MRFNRWMMFLSVVLITLSGCLRTESEPPLPPEAGIGQTARDVVRAYAVGLADSFDSAAAQLAAGTLTTAVETNALLQSANVAARKAAFHPLDAQLNDELGGDQWNVEQAQQIFREVSAGLRSQP